MAIPWIYSLPTSVSAYEKPNVMDNSCDYYAMINYETVKKTSLEVVNANFLQTSEWSDTMGTYADGVDLSLTVFIFVTTIACLWLLYLAFYNSMLLGWIVSTFINKLFLVPGDEYIKIGSFTFSPLGGKVMFKDVKYITKDYRVDIYDGYIVIQYWLLDYMKSMEQEDKQCRAFVKLNGVEFSLYNRTRMYNQIRDLTKGQDVIDRIISEDSCDSLKGDDIDRAVESILAEVTRSRTLSGKRSSVVGEDSVGIHSTNTKTSLTATDLQPSRSTNVADTVRTLMQQIFPVVKLAVSKATVTLGSPAIGSVWSMSAQKIVVIHSSFTEQQVNNMADLYREITKIKVLDGAIQYSRNSDCETESERDVQEWERRLPDRKRESQSPVVAFAVFKTKLAEIDYIFDVPGYVPEDLDLNTVPPEHCLNIRLFKDTHVYMGPWANYQRDQLFRFFFPWSCEDRPATKVQKHTIREYEYFRVTVDFMNEAMMKFPFLQTFKLGDDDKLATKSDISLKLDKGSRLDYFMDFKTTELEGSTNTMDLSVQNAQLTTSLYAHKLVDSDFMSLHIHMPSPRRFNAERTWKVDIAFEQPKVFLYRANQPFLDCFTSSWNFNGPTSQRSHVPVVYDINIKLSNFSVRLNVNDGNISHNPDDPNDNYYLDVCGSRGTVTTRIDNRRLMPIKTNSTICIKAPAIVVYFKTPSSSSFHQTTAQVEDEKGFWSMRDFKIVISNTTHTIKHDLATDNMSISVTATESDFLVYAHFVNALLMLISNYAGGNKWVSKHANHFFERQAELRALRPDYHDMSVCSNEYVNQGETQMMIRITDCIFRLPHTLYSCPKPLYMMHCTEAVVDVRNTPSFLEMMFSLNPITLLPANQKAIRITNTFLARESLMTSFKLRSHWLYGAPPVSENYASFYDINIGEVGGQLSYAAISSLTDFAGVFMYHWNNKENKFLFDACGRSLNVLELSANVAPVNFNIIGRECITHVRLADGIKLQTYGIIQNEYHSKIVLAIDDLLIRQLLLVDNAENQNRSGSPTRGPSPTPILANDNWAEVGYFITAVHVKILNKLPGVSADVNEQKLYLRYHDRSSHRLEWVLGKRRHLVVAQNKASSWINDKCVHGNMVGETCCKQARNFRVRKNASGHKRKAGILRTNSAKDSKQIFTVSRQSTSLRTQRQVNQAKGDHDTVSVCSSNEDDKPSQYKLRSKVKNEHPLSADTLNNFVKKELQTGSWRDSSETACKTVKRDASLRQQPRSNQHLPTGHEKSKEVERKHKGDNDNINFGFDAQKFAQSLTSPFSNARSDENSIEASSNLHSAQQTSLRQIKAHSLPQNDSSLGNRTIPSVTSPQHWTHHRLTSLHLSPSLEGGVNEVFTSTPRAGSEVVTNNLSDVGEVVSHVNHSSRIINTVRNSRSKAASPENSLHINKDSSTDICNADQGIVEVLGRKIFDDFSLGNSNPNIILANGANDIQADKNNYEHKIDSESVSSAGLDESIVEDELWGGNLGEDDGNSESELSPRHTSNSTRRHVVPINYKDGLGSLRKLGRRVTKKATDSIPSTLPFMPKRSTHSSSIRLDGTDTGRSRGTETTLKNGLGLELKELNPPPSLIEVEKQNKGTTTSRMSVSTGDSFGVYLTPETSPEFSDFDSQGIGSDYEEQEFANPTGISSTVFPYDGDNLSFLSARSTFVTSDAESYSKDDESTYSECSSGDEYGSGEDADYDDTESLLGIYDDSLSYMDYNIYSDDFDNEEDDEELQLWERLYATEDIAVNNTPAGYLRYLALHSVHMTTLNPLFSGGHGNVFRDEVQALPSSSHSANNGISSGLIAAAINGRLEERCTEPTSSSDNHTHPTKTTIINFVAPIRLFATPMCLRVTNVAIHSLMRTPSHGLAMLDRVQMRYMKGAVPIDEKASFVGGKLVISAPCISLHLMQECGHYTAPQESMTSTPRPTRRYNRQQNPQYSQKSSHKTSCSPPTQNKPINVNMNVQIDNAGVSRSTKSKCAKSAFGERGEATSVHSPVTESTFHDMNVDSSIPSAILLNNIDDTKEEMERETMPVGRSSNTLKASPVHCGPNTRRPSTMARASAPNPNTSTRLCVPSHTVVPMQPKKNISNSITVTHDQPKRVKRRAASMVAAMDKITTNSNDGHKRIALALVSVNRFALTLKQIDKKTPHRRCNGLVDRHGDDMKAASFVKEDLQLMIGRLSCAEVGVQIRVERFGIDPAVQGLHYTRIKNPFFGEVDVLPFNDVIMELSMTNCSGEIDFERSKPSAAMLRFPSIELNSAEIAIDTLAGCGMSWEPYHLRAAEAYNVFSKVNKMQNQALVHALALKSAQTFDEKRLVSDRFQDSWRVTAYYSVFDWNWRLLMYFRHVWLSCTVTEMIEIELSIIERTEIDSYSPTNDFLACVGLLSGWYALQGGLSPQEREEKCSDGIATRGTPNTLCVLNSIYDQATDEFATTMPIAVKHSVTKKEKNLEITVSLRLAKLDVRILNPYTHHECLFVDLHDLLMQTDYKYELNVTRQLGQLNEVPQRQTQPRFRNTFHSAEPHNTSLATTPPNLPFNLNLNTFVDNVRDNVKYNRRGRPGDTEATHNGSTSYDDKINLNNDNSNINSLHHSDRADTPSLRQGMSTTRSLPTPRPAKQISSTFMSFSIVLLAQKLFTSVDGDFIHVIDRITDIAQQNVKRKKALNSMKLEQRGSLRTRARQATVFNEDIKQDELAEKSNCISVSQQQQKSGTAEITNNTNAYRRRKLSIGTILGLKDRSDSVPVTDKVTKNVDEGKNTTTGLPPVSDEKMKKSQIFIKIFSQVEEALLVVKAGEVALDLRSKLQLIVQEVENGLDKHGHNRARKKSSKSDKANEDIPCDLVLTFSMPEGAVRVTYGIDNPRDDTRKSSALSCINIDITNSLLLISRVHDLPQFAPRYLVFLSWDSFAIQLPQSLNQLETFVERFDQSEYVKVLLDARRLRKNARLCFINRPSNNVLSDNTLASNSTYTQTPTTAKLTPVVSPECEVGESSPNTHLSPSCMIHLSPSERNLKDNEKKNAQRKVIMARLKAQMKKNSRKIPFTVTLSLRRTDFSANLMSSYGTHYEANNTFVRLEQHFNTSDNHVEIALQDHWLRLSSSMKRLSQHHSDDEIPRSFKPGDHSFEDLNMLNSAKPDYIVVPLPTIVGTVFVTQPQYKHTIRNLLPSYISIVVEVGRMDLQLSIDNIQHVVFLHTAFMRHFESLLVSLRRLKENAISNSTEIEKPSTNGGITDDTEMRLSKPSPTYVVKMTVSNMSVTVVIKKLALRLTVEDIHLYLLSSSADECLANSNDTENKFICDTRAVLSIELHDQNRHSPSSYWARSSTNIDCKVLQKDRRPYSSTHKAQSPSQKEPNLAMHEQQTPHTPTAAPMFTTPATPQYKGKAYPRSGSNAAESEDPSVGADAYVDGSNVNMFQVFVCATSTVTVLRQSAVDKAFQFFLDYRLSYEYWKKEFKNFRVVVLEATNELRDDLNMSEKTVDVDVEKFYKIHININRSCLVVPMGSLIDLSQNAPIADWPEKSMIVQVSQIELHSHGLTSAVGRINGIRMGFHEAFDPFDEGLWTITSDLNVMNEPDFPKRLPETFNSSLNLLHIPYATFQHISQANNSALKDVAEKSQSRSKNSVMLATEFVIGGILLNVGSEIGYWVGRLHYMYVVLRRQVNELQKANEIMLSSFGETTNANSVQREMQSSSSFLGRWAVHMTLKIKEGRMVLLTPAMQNKNVNDDVHTVLLPFEGIHNVKSSLDPAVVTLPSFTIKGTYSLQSYRVVRKANIRNDGVKRHLFGHVHLGSFSDNLTFRPNLLDFVEQCAVNYKTIADEVYEKYHVTISKDTVYSEPPISNVTSEETSTLDATMDAMAQTNTTVVVVCKMDSSTFSLSCLPKSLINCMVRLPTIDMAYSKSPSYSNQHKRYLLDMHCLTINVAQAYIKVHHPYSSAVSFQLDLSSIRLNIAVDRHFMSEVKEPNYRSSAETSKSHGRRESFASQSSFVSTNGTGLTSMGTPRNIFTSFDDLHVDSETATLTTLSTLDSDSRTDYSTKTYNRKRKRARNKRLIVAIQCDVDKTSLIYNTRQLDELLQFINMWASGINGSKVLKKRPALAKPVPKQIVHEPHMFVKEQKQQPHTQMQSQALHNNHSSIDSSSGNQDTTPDTLCVSTDKRVVSTPHTSLCEVPAAPLRLDTGSAPDLLTSEVARKPPHETAELADDADTDEFHHGSFEGSSSDEGDDCTSKRAFNLRVYTPKYSRYRDAMTIIACIRLKKYTITTNLGQAIGKAILQNKNLLINLSMVTTFPAPLPDKNNISHESAVGVGAGIMSEGDGSRGGGIGKSFDAGTTSTTPPCMSPSSSTTADTEMMIRLYLEAAELTSDGSNEYSGLLNGTFGVNQIQLVATTLMPSDVYAQFHSPSSSKRPLYPCLNAVVFSVENMDANVKYHANPILVLDVSELKFSIKDHWTMRATKGMSGFDSNSLMEGVDLDVTSNYAYIIVSKETAPSFTNVIKKIMRLTQEQTERFMGRTNNIMGNDTLTSLHENTVDFAHQVTKFQSSLFNGRVNFRGNEILVALFWHSFLDPTWAVIHLQNYEVTYLQRMNTKYANRRCDIRLGTPDTYSLSVRRMEGSVASAKAHDRDIEAWIDSVVKAPSMTRIIHAGQMYMCLKSHHNLLSPVIQMKLVTDFPDSIEVSLDVSMYLWLNQLFKLYMDENSRRAKNRHPAGKSEGTQTHNAEYPESSHLFGNVKSLNNNAEPPNSHESGSEAAIASRESISLGTSATRSVNTHSSSDDDILNLQYETLQFVLNPELKLPTYRGNFAPPDIEWILSKLGFVDSRRSIPKAIHEYLINRLYVILRVFANQTANNETVVMSRDRQN
eukprot:CFRG1914T1